MTKDTRMLKVTFLAEAQLKERFAKVAKANDRVPSQLLREFMKQYLKENAQGSLI